MKNPTSIRPCLDCFGLPTMVAIDQTSTTLSTISNSLSNSAGVASLNIRFFPFLNLSYPSSITTSLASTYLDRLVGHPATPVPVRYQFGFTRRASFPGTTVVTAALNTLQLYQVAEVLASATVVHVRYYRTSTSILHWRLAS